MDSKCVIFSPHCRNDNSRTGQAGSRSKRGYALCGKQHSCDPLSDGWHSQSDARHASPVRGQTHGTP